MFGTWAGSPSTAHGVALRMSSDRMAAHLDILEWRLERVRREACAALGERRRLAAEAVAIWSAARLHRRGSASLAPPDPDPHQQPDHCCQNDHVRNQLRRDECRLPVFLARETRPPSCHDRGLNGSLFGGNS
jgi:hypothetical protein